MGDIEEKDLRSHFFPLTVNSDKGKFPHVEILHQIPTETVYIMLEFFSCGQEKLCWNSDLLKVKHKFNFLLILGRQKNAWGCTYYRKENHVIFTGLLLGR